MEKPETKDLAQPALRLVDAPDQQRQNHLIADALVMLPTGVAVFDQNDRLLHLNAVFREILPADIDPNLTHRPEFLAALLSCIHSTAVAEAETWCENLSINMPVMAVDPACWRLASGRTFCFRSAPTSFGGCSLTANDVSLLREHLQVANSARALAESEITAKTDYLAMMTHELRTPMNGVVGMANLLAESELNDEQRLFVETIVSSGNSLLGLINQILDNSKEQALCLTVNSEAFDLERSIHEVILLLQTKIVEKGLEIVVDYDMFLPTAFIGDKGRIRQVLLNLIGNAIKFTTKGHVLVRVVGVPEAEKAQNIHITVEDTGIGIPKDQIGGVFGKYTQVNSGETDGIEGTGLGLAITKELVEMMGGEIWAHSEIGKGSCFGFTLEMNADETIPTPVQYAADLPKLAAIVADLAINRQVMQKQLKMLGITSIAFASATAAREYFETNAPPDFVFIEHRPPALNGTRLALGLRKMGLVVPIVLSASRTEFPEISASRPFNSKLMVAPVRRADIVKMMAQLGGEASDEQAVPQSNGNQNGKLRVLVAEDNATNQLVFQKFVKDQDIQLRFVGDGDAAVTAFTEFRPDLIFMDISMPKMDGREATRIIRATEDSDGLPRTMIIALTAYIGMGDIGANSEAGFDFFMSKPLNKTEICTRIETSRQQQQQKFSPS